MTKTIGPPPHKRKRGRPQLQDALYRTIAETMRERMSAGVWGSGFTLPSLRKMAREFGAGPITIRGALELLRMEGRLEKTRGGQLLVQAPSGVRAATHRLAVEVVSSYLDAYLRTNYGRMVQEGLTLEVTNQGRALLLAHNFRFLAAVPSGFDRLPADGVLLWGNFRKDVLQRYERMNLPIVLVDRPPANWKMHSACVDNENAAFDATRHLIALGHRRIAFIRQIHIHARDVDPDTVERQKGYERALRESGLRVRAELILNSLGTDNLNSPSIRSLFVGRAQPTAVLAVDSDKARLVLSAASQRGLAIPRDLSVVCFQERDGTHAEISGPRVDFRELGRQAALLLLEAKFPPQVRRIPAPWCEGRTVASRKPT